MKSILKNAFQSENSRPRALSCPVCGQTFYLREDLNSHKAEAHGLITPLGRSALGASLVALGLRIYLGTVMVMHGLPKLTKRRNETQSAMAKMGVPKQLTFLTSLLELIGGIFLIMGFLVPIVSSLFAAEMIGTTVLSKEKMGKQFLSGGKKPSYELDVIYAGAFVALALLGAGAISIDEKLGI